MSNSIRGVEIIDESLTPAECVARVVVSVAKVTPTTEIRGRLTGPRCVYTATGEVDYPSRRLTQQAGPNQVLGRVVIPEPSLWDPESPFLYQGLVELWQDGQRCDQTIVPHGLRL